MPIYSFGSALLSADIVDVALTESIIVLDSIGIAVIGVCMDGSNENR